MTNEFILTDSEHTRMVQTHLALNELIARMDQLTVGLGLVWLWTWDTIKNYYTMPDDYIMKDEDTVFRALWEATATNNGFSLEYGAEEHEEEVREWLVNRGLMQYADDVLEEEEEEQDADE